MRYSLGATILEHLLTKAGIRLGQGALMKTETEAPRSRPVTVLRMAKSAPN